MIKEKAKKMFAAIWNGSIGLYAVFLIFVKVCLYIRVSSQFQRLILYEFSPLFCRLALANDVITGSFEPFPIPTMFLKLASKYCA